MLRGETLPQSQQILRLYHDFIAEAVFTASALVADVLPDFGKKVIDVLQSSLIEIARIR